MTAPHAGLAVIGGAPFRSVAASTDRMEQLVLDLQGAGATVRVIRGDRSRTVDALFDELSAALQFPLYFGSNWAAVDECLSDLDRLGWDGPIVLVVPRADELLVESTADLAVFVRVVIAAAVTYAEPIAVGAGWDRDAVAFHVVLAATDLARWVDAGAAIAPLN
jgi:hypothetical protein